MLKRRLFSKPWRWIVAVFTSTFLLLIFKTGNTIYDKEDRKLFSKISSSYDQVLQQTATRLKSVSVQHRLIGRRMLIEQLCDQGRNGFKPYEITGNKKINVSYCVVPKAGCTLWIRIFKFLAGQKNYTVNPMEISKFEVHYQEIRKHKRFNFRTAFVLHSLRVVTVRNPWTRLWSAYIDKLFLPDFWQTKGKQIVRMVRRHASNISLTCGHDVTFAEFIQYVINMGHNKTFVKVDKHWLPASDLCDPCVYRPDIIAKQETLLDDLKYVLNNRGMGEILASIVQLNHTEYEILDEINYNFAIYGRNSHCTSLLELCKRMWNAFKFNGYLPEHEHFNESILLNERTFFDLIMKTRKRNYMTKEDTKRFRRISLIHAYSKISPTNMFALKELYKEDFRYFKYDSLLK